MSKSSSEPTKSLVSKLELSPIPELIQYYDKYARKFRSIANPASEDIWELWCNGDLEAIDLGMIPEVARTLLRHVLVQVVVKYAPNTSRSFFKTFVWVCNQLGADIFFKLLELAPMELREFWMSIILPAFIEGRRRPDALKFYLVFLCENNVGELTPGDSRRISKLPGPKADLYAAVRSGEVFLSTMEKVAIVRRIDDLAEAAREDRLSNEQLRDGCMLIASYRHGMRAVQISMVNRQDVVIRKDEFGSVTSVHVSFSIEKRRNLNERTPETRKIKFEWISIYTRYCSRFDDGGGRASDVLFGLSGTGVSFALKSILGDILPESRSATDLRHTGAQHIVDHGGSAEDVARFLGQKGTRTSLIYFGHSTNQAELLNKALAASKVYADIAIIGRDKVISPSRLKAMDPEHQVGGVPHGVPIAGIGACQAGQSLCDRNPVISCYGCSKFMPVRDGILHREVLQLLRQVVKRFADHNSTSPAFAQLVYSITLIERFLADENS